MGADSSKSGDSPSPKGKKSRAPPQCSSAPAHRLPVQQVAKQTATPSKPPAANLPPEPASEVLETAVSSPMVAKAGAANNGAQTVPPLSGLVAAPPRDGEAGAVSSDGRIRSNGRSSLTEARPPLTLQNSPIRPPVLPSPVSKVPFTPTNAFSGPARLNTNVSGVAGAILPWVTSSGSLYGMDAGGGLNGSGLNAAELMRANSVSYCSPQPTTPMLKSYRDHSIVMQTPTSPVTAGVAQSSAPSAFSNIEYTSPIHGVSFSSDGMVAPPMLHTKLVEIRGQPIGMENYGNTCYGNSVLQLLYHCTPFRVRILEMYEAYHGTTRHESFSGLTTAKLKKGSPGVQQSSLLFTLCGLFATLHKLNNRVAGDASSGDAATSKKNPQQRKTSATPTRFGPREFLLGVREAYPPFRNNLQQDAHEFAMFVLNNIIDTEGVILSHKQSRAVILDEKSKRTASGDSGTAPGLSTIASILSALTPGHEAAKPFSAPDSNDGKERRTSQNKHSSANSGGGSRGERRLSAQIAAQPQESSATPALGVSKTSASLPLGGEIPLQPGGEELSSPLSTGASAKRPKVLALGNAASEHGTLVPIESIFAGEFVTVTTCAQCSTSTIRKEKYIDLSVNIEPRCSLTWCLASFTDTEYLEDNNKVHCQTCNEARPVTVSIRMRRMPEYALIIHLKRFRYDEKRRGFVKRADHVALPYEIQFDEYDVEELQSSLTSPPSTMGLDMAASPPTTHTCEKGKQKSKKKSKGAEASSKRPQGTPQLREVEGLQWRGLTRFTLMGFVAHQGEGPNLGHYVACIRYGQQWRKFDDEVVTNITEREVQQFFGVPISVESAVTSTAYILLYERVF